MLKTRNKQGLFGKQAQNNAEQFRNYLEKRYNLEYKIAECLISRGEYPDILNYLSVIYSRKKILVLFFSGIIPALCSFIGYRKNLNPGTVVWFIGTYIRAIPPA